VNGQGCASGRGRRRPSHDDCIGWIGCQDCEGKSNRTLEHPSTHHKHSLQCRHFDSSNEPVWSWGPVEAEAIIAPASGADSDLQTGRTVYVL
jgi:hypothetical protein